MLRIASTVAAAIGMSKHKAAAGVRRRSNAHHTPAAVTGLLRLRSECVLSLSDGSAERQPSGLLSFGKRNAPASLRFQHVPGPASDRSANLDCRVCSLSPADAPKCAGSYDTPLSQENNMDSTPFRNGARKRYQSFLNFRCGPLALLRATNPIWPESHG